MAELGGWSPASSALILPLGEVHVWRADLECEESLLQELRSTLAPDETARAGRYHFEADRKHFLVARGVLRDLLARYTGQAPGDLVLQYGKFGKPFLVQGSPTEPVRFNVSHSNALAVLSFSRGRELGIDLERVRLDFDSDDIAARYFAPQEVAELRALPSALRAEGFFLCWTRKEAYIKARGDGLQIPLQSFSVSLTPGAQERLDSTDCARWSLYSLRPAAEYVGAVVIEGRDSRIHLFDWKP